MDFGFWESVPTLDASAFGLWKKLIVTARIFLRDQGKDEEKVLMKLTNIHLFVDDITKYIRKRW